MTSSDPWATLVVPHKEATVTARRIDDTSRWDFYWGRDHGGRCMLILRHGPDATPRDRLPRLKGVDVFLHPLTAKERPSLVLRLLDGSLREIFFRLCLDIIDTTSAAETEVGAVAVALSRTWRWHHLLRGGGSGLLSREEQKGLVGELLVLERYLLPALGSSGIVGAWSGPLGGAKDFIAGRIALESKARATADPPEIHVSSEFQLDDDDLDAVFVHVSVVDPADPDAEGFTVSDVACRVRAAVAQAGERVAARFDALLAAAGFWSDDDYSADRWVSGGQSVYRVTADFPRLTPATIPAGVSSVKYTVALSDCAPFLAPPQDLELALKGGMRDA